MKTKYFLVGFLLLSMFAFSSSVKAAESTLKIAEDDELIWEIKTLDEDALEEYLDIDGDDLELYIEMEYGEDAEVGAQRKWLIKGIEEEDVWNFDAEEVDGWEIEVDVWFWTDDPDDFDDDPDIEDGLTGVIIDPDDVGGDENIISMGSVIGTPVADYLADLEWVDDVDVDGSTVTYVVDADDIEAYLTFFGMDPDVEDDMTFETKYNNKGVCSSEKVMLADGTVVGHIALKGGAIPGYELPILLGVAGISALGLVYIVMKKK